MPRAGVSARPERRYATPWSEELDREAFRFPSAREVRPREVRPREVRAERPVRAVGGTERPVRAVGGTERPVHEPGPTPAPARARARIEAAPAAPARRPAAPATPTPRADNGRRTVTIRGYGAERNLPVARPTLRRHERPGFRPDRAALWAVLLGLCLILVAAASAHGAILH